MFIGLGWEDVRRMITYKNIMENMVEEMYEKMKDSLGCCQCERCHNDIVAYALNRLPPHYVVSRSGALYAKTFTMEKQHEMDIATEIAKGAMLVRSNPRHDEERSCPA